MSYIPPHKRHSQDPSKPSPVPDSLVTKFKKNLNFKSSTSNDKRDRVIFSGDSITKWFLFGSNGIEDEFPSSVILVPLSSDSVEGRNGVKPSILMNTNVQKVDVNTEESKEEDITRWILLVAEKVEKDLVLAYERAKAVTLEEETHRVLRLVASFGKNLFYADQVQPFTKCSSKNSGKIFSPNLPTSYIQHVKTKVVPSHGFCIDQEEKERFIVKVTHHTRNEIINCKCTADKDGRLSLYKVDLSVVRHLLVDVSCIDKNVDMRLMLGAKRKLTSLTEEEISNIQALLDSAIVDLNVKGGLRWSLGISSSWNGYKVFEVVHINTTVYRNQTLRLRVRKTERFNERTGSGEIQREVALMLKDLNTKLQDENTDRGCVEEMLKSALGTLWDLNQIEILKKEKN